MSHGIADKEKTRYNTASKDNSANDLLRRDARKAAEATPYLLTVKQTAQRLQLGINCVYNLTKADCNPLPTIVIGRSIRIPVSALERWLETQTHG